MGERRVCSQFDCNQTIRSCGQVPSAYHSPPPPVISSLDGPPAPSSISSMAPVSSTAGPKFNFLLCICINIDIKRTVVGGEICIITNFGSGGPPGSVSLTLIMARATGFFVPSIPPDVKLTATEGADLRFDGLAPFWCQPVHWVDRREMRAMDGRKQTSHGTWLVMIMTDAMATVRNINSNFSRCQSIMMPLK